MHIYVITPPPFDPKKHVFQDGIWTFYFPCLFILFGRLLQSDTCRLQVPLMNHFLTSVGHDDMRKQACYDHMVFICFQMGAALLWVQLLSTFPSDLQVFSIASWIVRLIGWSNPKSTHPCTNDLQAHVARIDPPLSSLGRCTVWQSNLANGNPQFIGSHHGFYRKHIHK